VAGRETSALWCCRDVQFYDALACAAHSPRLAEAMIAIRGELFLPVDEALHEPRTEDLHAFHKALIAAVRERDSERVAGTVRAHIAETRRMVYRALEESDGAEVDTSRTAAQGTG